MLPSALASLSLGVSGGGFRSQLVSASEVKASIFEPYAFRHFRSFCYSLLPRGQLQACAREGEMAPNVQRIRIANQPA